MKKTLYVLLSTFILTVANVNPAIAQDTLGGIIKYEYITKLDFSERLKNRPDDQRFRDMIADMPEESRIVKTLYFNSEESLYEEIASENEALDPKVRRATFFMNMGRSPKPGIEKVYCDLNKEKVVEQLDFMMRKFILESEKTSPKWKLGTEMKKIQGYVCMNAEAIIVRDSLRTDTALVWYSPQIPISVGPEKYYGLPGAVLAVELNGETKLLATSIELIIPDKEKITKPSDGKKVSQKELDQIVKEKVEEFKQMRQGMGPGGGGRPH